MNDKTILRTFLIAIGLTTVISVLYLTTNGVADESIRFMLRTSAQFSFTFLILILITRPLYQLHNKPYSKWLMANRTLLGASFAGIHTGHMFLILFRVYEIPSFKFVWSDNILGVLVYLTIFTMLITSFKIPRKLIGAKLWKMLHKFGLYFITTGFILIIFPHSLDKITEVSPWVTSMLLIAFGLRVVALFKQKD